MRRTVKLRALSTVWGSADSGKSRCPVAGDQDKRDDTFDDEASRLTNGLQSCRNLVANYRAMLADSSNDNSVDDLSGDDSELA